MQSKLVVIMSAMMIFDDTLARIISPCQMGGCSSNDEMASTNCGIQLQYWGDENII